MIINVKYFFSLFLLFLFPHYCYLCKKEGKSLCDDCLQKLDKSYDTPFPYITSMYSFKNKHTKKIIHAIKYFHRKDLIEPMSLLLIKEIKMRQLTSHILIPIPMPVLRKYSRGYNHTEAVASHISQHTGLSMRNDILIRKNNKKRQVLTNSRRERIDNQHGAFTVRAIIPGVNIILIDDVTTTGATLSEARKVLIEHGAAHVVALTIAH